MTIHKAVASPAERVAQLRELLGVKPLPMTPAAARQILALPEEQLEDHKLWSALTGELGGADVSWPLGYWSWRALGESLDCHPALAEGLETLAPVIMVWVSRAEGSWMQTEHPLPAALDKLFFHLERWYPEVGPADKLKQRFDTLAASLAQVLNEADVLAAVTAFNRDCDKDLERAARLASRLEASELGHIRTAVAQNRVNALFNQYMAERPVTEEVAQFVTEHLLPALQFMQINESATDRDWEFWSGILRLLVWSLAPEKSPEDVQAFFDKGPVLVRQLEKAAPPGNCKADAYQHFVETVSGQVITMLKGQALDTITLPAREVDDSALQAEHLQVSAGAGEDWRSGDWIVFEAEDGCELRCQCLLQVPGTDQLLFVNRAGRKVLQKSCKQMDLCRETGIARALPNTPVFTTAQATALHRLTHWQDTLLQDARAARERERQEQAEARAQLAARQAEKMAREKARAKAEAEAARLAAEEAERQRQREEQSQQKAREAESRNAEAQVDALTLGTWAELPDATGARVRAKLAVSMRSTGRYIFVDRVGTQVAEYRREQLIALLLAGQVTFQQPERGFESRLESIVRGLRKAE